MLLKNILDLTYHRCNEDIEIPKDPRMDTMFVNAINQGYCFVATNVDMKTKVASLSYSSSIKVPVDYFELVEIVHSVYGRLSETDYVLTGDLFIPKIIEAVAGTTFSMTYVNIPTFITVETTDIPIKDMYCVALSAYASYMYMLSEKQFNAATMLLKEFDTIVGIKGVNSNEA